MCWGKYIKVPMGAQRRIQRVTPLPMTLWHEQDRSPGSILTAGCSNTGDFASQFHVAFSSIVTGSCIFSGISCANYSGHFCAHPFGSLGVGV